MSRGERKVLRVQKKQARAGKRRGGRHRLRERVRALGSRVADFIAELLEVLAP